MLDCQKDKFSLPDNVSYLNCAYFSPLLKAVEAVGHAAVSKKNLPFEITLDDFFNPAIELKKRFAQLVSVSDHERIAMVPGVSYGMETVARNISLSKGEHILVAEEQFPSNYYPWFEKARISGAEIKTIGRSVAKGGTSWNEQIVDSINSRTRIVAIPHTHWADGYKFDLKAIREACNQHDAYLIIDGSQSVGALPLSVADIQPDALVVAGYKWLLGPYSLGLAYFNEKFDDGDPIEHCWINKEGSEDFRTLANYREGYKPKAARFNVSESSNFILVPMLSAAIHQLLEWDPANIQDYCQHISKSAFEELQKIDCQVEQAATRANHLFGIRIGPSMNLEKIKQSLEQEKVYVSFRGNAIRISAHLFNTEGDFEKLIHCIKKGQ